MVSFKDKRYIWAQKRRFFGKGESNLEKLAKLSPTLEAWEKRAVKIRNGILKGANLDPLPEKTPLNPVIHSLRIYGEYQVENVYFESIPGFYVTGSLYRPTKQTGKLPILLKPHGHKKNKRYTDDNQNICATIARMGVIVFTYDMVGYACSTQVEHKIKNACTLQTWNSIRAVDFVLSLPNVDPSLLGVTGGSGGGTQTFLLTAVDPRISFSAPVVMVSSFFYGGCVCESGLPIHKGVDYKTNNAEIAALAAPKPQCLISDGGDWTRMNPVWEYPFIKRIYDLYGKGDLVENAHFPDEVHNYGPSKQQAAYDFFSRQFKISSDVLDRMRGDDGIFSVDDNVIEEEMKLKVFNEDHPRPSNALKSEAEIIAKLKELQK